MEFLNIDCIQKECIRLLTEFISVCEKYSLTWFLDSGSLLGCVRNGHMIDWDDDIDVIMPREDYNILLKLGQREFSNVTFFQTPETDSCFSLSIKLRSNVGTCLTAQECSGSHHKGIFIDIFPLDAYPGEKEELAISGMLREFDKYTSLSIYKRKELFSLMNDLLTDMTNRNADSEYVSDIIFSRYSQYIGSKFKRTAYDGIIKRRFENILVNIPVGFDEILTTWYGKDWQIPMHTSTFHNGVYLAENNSRKQYSLDEYYYLLSKQNEI